MPPVNDDFANATVLNPAGGTLQGDNTGATSDGVDDPLISLGYGIHTIWYKINPIATDRLLAIGTDAPISGTPIVDSAIGVYSGTTLAGLAQIATDDDSGPGYYSQLNSILLSANDTIYVEVTGYDDTVEGGFTLTWTLIEATGPTNDYFVNAICLTAGTHTISGNTFLATNQAGEPGGGGKTVWYTLQGTDNPNGGTLEFTGTADLGGFMAVRVGYKIGELSTVGFANEISLTFTFDPVFIQGPIIYLQIGDVDGFSLTYTWTPFASLPVVAATPGDELVSPSLPVTRYPDHAYVVRVSDFAATGVTVHSGGNTPNNEYITHNQVITPSFADFWIANANAVTVNDTIVLDPSTIPLSTGVWYYVWALVRVVGEPSTEIGRTWQKFRELPSANIFHQQVSETTNWHIANNILPYTNELWKYIQIGGLDFSNSGVINDPGDVFKLRIGVCDAGTEVQIAQLVLLPGGDQGVSPYNWSFYHQDFSYWEFSDSYIPTYAGFGRYGPDYNGILDADTTDVRSDALGSSSVEYNYDTTNEDWIFVRDYQDSDDPTDVEKTNLLNYAYPDFDVQPSSNVWLLGSEWQSYQVVENDVFSRASAYVYGTQFLGGGDTNFFSCLGESPNGYWYLTVPTLIASAQYWDLNSYYGYTGPAYMGLSGSAAIMAFGGTDTQVVGFRAMLGSTVQNDNNYWTSASKSPPLVDMEDGIVEATVSWNQVVDGSDALGAQIARIGFGHRYTGSWDRELAFILRQKADGSLHAGIAASGIGWGGLFGSLTTPYYIAAETQFDTGYAVNDVIHMKFRRRRYLVEAKIWYDGDTEPSSWAYSGYIPGYQIVSSVYYLFPYPYGAAQALPSSTSHKPGNAYGPSTPFFASYCSFEQTVPTDNGGQHNRIVVTWDNFKVVYDPDGATDKDFHIRVESDDGSTVLVPNKTYTGLRHLWVYLGTRQWEQVDNASDEGIHGYTFYAWLSAGSGTLVAAGLGIGHRTYSRVYSCMTAITGIISMRWRRGKQR